MHVRRWLLGHGVLGFVLAAMAACGGSEPEPNPSGAQCGPNGRLHRGPGVEPHCHCDDGYEVQDDTCVLSVPPDDHGRTVPPPPEISGPDCGEHGQFDGDSCSCDSGFTQTGLGAERTCEEIPACMGLNDDFEPNDLPAQATMHSEVEGSLYACPADPDWFVFPVTAGDRVTAEVFFDGAAVDLDLFLFGPSSPDPRSFSVEASGDRESASFRARVDGTAGVLVMPYGIGQGSYSLTVDIEEGDAPICMGPGGFCRSSQDCCSGTCHVDHCH